MHIVYCQKSWRKLSFLSNKSIVFFLLFFIPWLGNAQVLTYQGRVFDSDGHPLEFANVVALSLPDSTFTEGTVTNHTGEFTISLKTPIDRPLFKVSLMGYQTTYSPPVEVDSIVLKKSSIELAEVAVRGGKSAFSIKGDKVVCNIAGTALSSESFINDLLGKLPGFYTQGDQLKSINQGSIKYFLNNRPVTAEEVARLDVKTVKSIEIDRHPGARYSGEVGSVVFIHTNTILEGTSAFLRSYTRVNHRFSQGIDGEVRYRYKRFSIALGADYTLYQLKSQQENSFELLQSLNYWKVKAQDTKKKNKNTDQTYFANLEYSLTDQHQINLRYTRHPSRTKVCMIGNSSVWKADECLSENFENNSATRSTEDNINLYYKGILGKYWTIDLSSDWYHQRSTSEQNLQEEQRLTKIFSGANNSIWGFSPRAVYQTQRSRIEMGVDWSKSVIQGWTELNIDDAQPTDNKIQEIKRAGYLGGNWIAPNKHWNIDFGLRFERTSKNYQDKTSDTQSQDFSYQTLLPSLALSYSTGKWKHQLNYNSSVMYPSFNQLISGDVYINRYNLKKSNPSLERSIVHNISYDCSFRWLYLSAGYTYTCHPILETFELDSYQGEYRVIVRPQNLSHMQGIHVIANAAPRFGFYEPRWMLGYIQNFMTLPRSKDIPSRSISKPFVILRLDNSLTLPKQWIVNLDYSYNGAGSNGYIEYSSSSSLNLSVLKYLFNKKLQISLKLTDIFDTSTPRISGTFQGVLLNGFSWMDSRAVRFNIIWHFNQHRTAQKHSSISSEVNRL